MATVNKPGVQPNQQIAPPLYGEYISLLTQSSTTSPVETKLKNSTPIALSWTYLGAGQYKATLNSEQPVAQLSIKVANTGYANCLVSVTPHLDGTNVDYFTITTSATGNLGALSDGVLLAAELEIKLFTKQN